MDSKISGEFRARLKLLKPHQKVRAILLLKGPAKRTSVPRRQSPRQRKAALEEMRKASDAAIKDIDNILSRVDGERLAEPNALGTVPVEAPPSGILALAASDSVAAVLEDQPISLVP